MSDSKKYWAFISYSSKDKKWGSWLQNVTEVYVIGIATDYCVKFTALDAADLGYKTFLIEDACRGVNLNPGDIEKALTEMQVKGVAVVQSKQLKEL